MGSNTFLPKLEFHSTNEWWWDNNPEKEKDSEDKKEENNPNDIEHDTSKPTNPRDLNAPTSEMPPHDPADPTKPRLSPSKPIIMREIKYVREWFDTSR